MAPLYRCLQAFRFFSRMGTCWLVGVLALISASSSVRAQCEVAKFTSLDDGTQDSEGFGREVALSGDLAVIGAPNHDGYDNHSGAAYVFRFNGVDWIQEAKLVAPDGAEHDFFGWDVAIDGETIVIGSHRKDDACPPENPDCNSGAAFVFRREGTSWIQTAELFAPDASPGQEFGWSVSISGELIAVGSAPPQGALTGAAYVVVPEKALYAAAR